MRMAMRIAAAERERPEPIEAGARPARLVSRLRSALPSREAEAGPPPRIVVVGGGMAAQRFLESLIDRIPPGTAQITLVCEEPRPPYDRLNLGEVVVRAGPARPLREPDWYTANGIEVRLGEAVVEIDRARNRVHTANGAALIYDRLVLATGSDAVRPKLPGTDAERISLFRTAEDAERIARAANEAERVVVVGAGPLGLEVADQIRSCGCEVTVLEYTPRLLPRHLDVAGSEELVRTLTARGLSLRLSAELLELRSYEDGVRVILEGSESIEADWVVIAAGTRPRDELARAAGLECHPSGGIRVDEGLVTSDPAIFAIGECARLDDAQIGLAAPCYRMADVLADRWTQGTSRYRTLPLDFRLKIADVHVATIGDSLAEGPGIREICWTGGAVYRRIILREGRLVGAIAIGGTPDTIRIQEAIARRQRVSPRQEARLRRTGTLWRSSGPLPIDLWPEETTVCACKGVTCGELRTAWANGHRSSKQLQSATGAGLGCGTCAPLLAEIAGEATTGRKAGVGWGLPAAAAAVLVLLVAAAAFGPIPMARSVLETPSFDFLWRDGWWKQASGFSLLGLIASALLLSARERLPTILRSTFSNERVAHATIGVATVLALGVHTGLRMGVHLNAILMSCTIGLIALGGLTGLATTAERRLPSRLGAAIRMSCKQTHVALFLPIPVLVLFHVLAVYYY